MDRQSYCLAVDPVVTYTDDVKAGSTRTDVNRAFMS